MGPSRFLTSELVHLAVAQPPVLQRLLQRLTLVPSPAISPSSFGPKASLLFPLLNTRCRLCSPVFPHQGFLATPLTLPSRCSRHSLLLDAPQAFQPVQPPRSPRLPFPSPSSSEAPVSPGVLPAICFQTALLTPILSGSVPARVHSLRALWLITGGLKHLPVPRSLSPAPRSTASGIAPSRIRADLARSTSFHLRALSAPWRFTPRLGCRLVASCCQS